MVTSISVALNGMQKSVVLWIRRPPAGTAYHVVGKMAHIFKMDRDRAGSRRSKGRVLLSNLPESSQQPVIDDLEEAGHGF